MKVYKSNRKYNCPFCNCRYLRGELVNHVSEDHEEMIPEGFTAARVVYNYLNDTDHGICQSCGEPTEWNEDKWNYDSIHPTEKCKKIARQKALKNHKKKFNGKSTLLDDPEQQAKMLANRSISGTYRFSDGEEMSYVGTYEKRFLEFCDEILHLIANVDIFSIDGKNKEYIIEYIYKDKKHFWIPDYYIKPFNLMVDIKDGGSNKNNRDMKEYREKQIAKEQAIEKQGKFNYLRLTDNQFGQLLSIFLDIKYSLYDNRPKKIHINEYAGCSCGGHPMNNKEKIYSVSYSTSGQIIDGYGLMMDLISPNIFISDENKIKEVDCKDFLKDKKFTISEVYVNDKNKVLNDLRDISESDNYSLYDIIKSYNNKNIFVSENGYMIENMMDDTISKSYQSKCTYDLLHVGFPILEEDVLEKSKSILKGYQNLIIKEEVDGYYVENIITDNRSLSFKNIEDIQPALLDFMNSNF